MCPVLLALSFVWGTEDKLITSTNRPILLCSAATTVAVYVEITRVLLFTGCFFCSLLPQFAQVCLPLFFRLFRVRLDSAVTFVPRILSLSCRVSLPQPACVCPVL